MKWAKILLALFFVGWATYGFALFDIGRYSFNLLLLASVGLAFRFFRLSGFLEWPFLSLLLSATLSLVVAAFRDVPSEGMYSHFAQNLIAVIVAVSASRIRWACPLPWLQKFLLFMVILLVLYGSYQLAARSQSLPYAFLPITNQQIGSDEGYQRGYVKAMESRWGFVRVSSTFPEPSDLARFMLWVFCIGLTARKQRIGLALGGTAILGIVLSQSLGGLLGLVLIVLFDSLTTGRIRRLLGLLVALILSAGAVVTLSPDSLRSLTERVNWITSEGAQYLLLTGRFGDVVNNWQLIWEAPLLGQGLGSLTQLAPTSVVADTLTLLLIERGLIGGGLFLLPFAWTLLQLIRPVRSRETTIYLARLLLVTEVYHFLTFAALYFPPLHLALGLAVFAYRANQHRDHQAVSPP